MTTLKTQLAKHASLCLTGSEFLERFRDEILPHCSWHRMDLYLTAAFHCALKGGALSDVGSFPGLTHGQRVMLEKHVPTHDELMGLICYLSFAVVAKRRADEKFWGGQVDD